MHDFQTAIISRCLSEPLAGTIHRHSGSRPNDRRRHERAYVGRASVRGRGYALAEEYGHEAEACDGGAADRVAEIVT